MKKTSKLKLFTLLTAGVLLLSACGSSKNADRDTYAESAPMAAKSAGTINYAAADMEDAAVGDFYEEESYDEGSGNSGSTGAEEVTENGAAKNSRKLITTVNISTETDDVEGFAARIENKVNSLGGYLESSNVYTDKNYYGNDPVKAASITARVPSAKLEEFLNDVESNSNITSKSRNTDDVTLEYTDTEAHERALTLERDSLERMMEKAETVEDIMAIQSQLTDVRYRLDSIHSQLRTYDNKIDYSTVYLNVEETKKFTVTKEETAWDRIKNGFTDNLIDVMDGISEFIIWFLTHIPSIVIFGLFVFGIIMLIKAIALSHKKKAERKNAAKPKAPVKKSEPAVAAKGAAAAEPANDQEKTDAK